MDRKLQGRMFSGVEEARAAVFGSQYDLGVAFILEPEGGQAAPDHMLALVFTTDVSFAMRRGSSFQEQEPSEGVRCFRATWRKHPPQATEETFLDYIYWCLSDVEFRPWADFLKDAPPMAFCEGGEKAWKKVWEDEKFHPLRGSPEMVASDREFAEDWARLTQRFLQEGFGFEEALRKAYRLRAFRVGVSGLQYGRVVRALCASWLHSGEQLRSLVEASR